MKANNDFKNKSTQFWGYVKLISDLCGYSKKSKGVLTHSRKKILNALVKEELDIPLYILDDVMNYIDYRAYVLNNYVEKNLLDVVEAKKMFNHYYKYHNKYNLECSLPMNKQKNEKRAYAYYTGIINIITELTIRSILDERNYDFDGRLFDDDPRNLTYFTDEDDCVIGTLSRRFDGALPSIINPLAIWEIKEYYYTTTFGSRIADGVYETQLDGYEIKDILKEHDIECKHIYFIDAYHTWWNMGKPYLCRIIDLLHQGLVDEVIFGKEVEKRWPEIIRKLI